MLATGLVLLVAAVLRNGPVPGALAVVLIVPPALYWAATVAALVEHARGRRPAPLGLAAIGAACVSIGEALLLVRA